MNYYIIDWLTSLVPGSLPPPPEGMAWRIYQKDTDTGRRYYHTDLRYRLALEWAGVEGDSKAVAEKYITRKDSSYRGNATVEREEDLQWASIRKLALEMKYGQISVQRDRERSRRAGERGKTYIRKYMDNQEEA